MRSKRKKKVQKLVDAELEVTKLLLKQFRLENGMRREAKRLERKRKATYIA